MISVTGFDSLRDLRDQLGAMQENVTKEVRVAAWKAQKRIRGQIATELTKIINQPRKALIKATYSKIKPNGDFVIVIRGAFAMAVKRFKPKQTKAGVVAKTGKKTVYQNPFTGKMQTSDTGKQTFAGGFMGPRPGVISPKLRGVPVRRVGSKRLPIQAIPAVSVVLTIHQNPDKLPKIIKLAQAEFEKQVRERIRFLTLKKQKKLN